MKKAHKKLRFSDLPKDFQGLCSVHTPRPIHDGADYENTAELIDIMVLWNKEFTRDQDDYFELLVTLIEHYDSEHTHFPEVSPLEIIKTLFADHGLSGSDLARILGTSRQHGAMILRGERSITADHARLLGAHFKISPGVFL